MRAELILLPPVPHHIKKEHLEFDIEDHKPGFMESLGFSQFALAPHHDTDDGMRRRRVRVDIIGRARMNYVGKYQSCMV